MSWYGSLTANQWITVPLFLLISIFLVGMLEPTAVQKNYQVYFLGGQSNMDGLGQVEDLPADLQSPFEQVWIYHGNPAPDDGEIDGRGIWSQLRPGHGFGFSADGVQNNYSNLFGVELSFAQSLVELQPSINIALIKYSRAATSIDSGASGGFGCWEPDYSGANGVNQFDHFLNTVNRAMATNDIDGDGFGERLVPSGIVWMQGESDAAYTREIALQYHSNLTNLMAGIRLAL